MGEKKKRKTGKAVKNEKTIKAEKTKETARKSAKEKARKSTETAGKKKETAKQNVWQRIRPTKEFWRKLRPTKSFWLRLVLSLIFTLAITWDSFHNFSYVNFGITWIFAFLILHLVWRKLTDAQIAKKAPPKIRKWEFLVYGLLTIGMLTFAVLAHYPVSVINNDTLVQYDQALNNEYENWHPVLQTWFAYKLPWLFAPSLVFSTIFLGMIITAILMYFCYFCRKNFLNFGWTLLLLLLMILNPSFMTYAVSTGKDTIYAWMVFLSTLFLIQIAMTNGAWLKSPWTKIAFILATLGVLCFRHNGLVPFVLMYVGLAVAYRPLRKFSVFSAIIILLGFFTLTGPVYRLLGISPSGGLSESVGLMMGQIMYYHHNAPEDFSEEELAVLNDVADLSIWQEKYNARDFNDIKQDERVWDNYTENTSKNMGALIGIWWRQTWRHPKMFWRSYLNITSPIWEIGRPFKMNAINIAEWYRHALATEFDATSDQIEEYEIKYDEFVDNSALRMLFFDVGEGLMVILLALAIVAQKIGRKVGPYVPFLAVLGTTLTIMFMITGMEARFIYSQILCALPLLLYALSLKNKRNDTNLT